VQDRRTSLTPEVDASIFHAALAAFCTNSFHVSPTLGTNRFAVGRNRDSYGRLCRFVPPADGDAVVTTPGFAETSMVHRTTCSRFEVCQLEAA
jgi:hypothetical protein